MILASGHRVLHFERIDSTNAEARRLAEAGERGPLWLWADEQTDGRGRLGRSWVSEPGNLFATFLFTLSAGLEVAAQVSFVAALAVHDAIGTLRPDLAPLIKWPNDILIGGAKVSGILVEVVGSAPTRIAIGCGVNVAHAPQGTPYPVTSLSAPLSCGGELANAPTRGKGLEVESLLQHLDLSLSHRLQIWDEGRGFDSIREDWLARAFGIGSHVTAAESSGTFTSIAANGALVLTCADGTTKHIHSGEVKFAALEALREA